MRAPTTPETYELYGVRWPSTAHRADVIIRFIRGNGLVTAGGVEYRVPLFTLYRDLQSVLWPDDDHHEWSDLLLKTVLEERFIAVCGPRDSGKTRGMAKYALCDYFAFPNETLILMSSTDLRGLELRVWGDLKYLWVEARDHWPTAPGNPLDSMYGIFTDTLKEDTDIRDIRKGIICIPCLESGQKWTSGLQKFVGIKQKRRRLIGDEMQLMQDPYLNVVANLNKGDFKFVGMGNPLGDGDPLDKLAEPINGWDDLEELTVTTTWRNKWGGLTINYVGVDSPAIKHPGQFDYLITQKDIDTITQQFGKESAIWWNQAMGVRRKGVSLRKVITREMCRLFGAQDPVFWGGGEQVKVYAVDAGYGGDRCIGGEVTFGKDVNGRLVLSVGQPRIIPVRLYPNSVPESERKLPEDQIAEYVKADCERLDIPAANVYHDATGRGSLGSALARLWRHDTNPVEFGGKPSQGPVKSDLLIYDEKLRSKRLKRCDEQYTKRVSELWFAMRYVIESRQMRDLPTEVMEEMCVREWDWVKGAKQDVESKEDTKERLGRSPDMADWLAIAIWGACQRGFVIAAMSAQAPKTEQDDRWKRDLERRAARTRASYALTGA